MKKEDKSHFHSFSNIVTIVFIFTILKLNNILDWSWVQVFTPLIIYFLLWIVTFIILLFLIKDDIL